jgi:hypothetical protein
MTRDAAAAADIIWTNRSTTTTGGTGDNDHFGAVFGVNANKVARGRRCGHHRV